MVIANGSHTNIKFMNVLSLVLIWGVGTQIMSGRFIPLGREGRLQPHTNKNGTVVLLGSRVRLVNLASDR